MIYAVYGFVAGFLIPYMSRRFAKFMPATPAYALYRLVKPNKTARKVKFSTRYKQLKRKYLSLLAAGRRAPVLVSGFRLDFAAAGGDRSENASFA